MTSDDEPLLVLIASVPLETERIRKRLDDMRAVRVGRKPAWRGSLGGAGVILIAGGMGKSNAAQALTAVVETHAVRGVLGFGVGGAYPASGLNVGDVALATTEFYGDDGVESPTGWLSTEGIGIPLLQSGDSTRFNEFPFPPDRVAAASRALANAGIEHATGPFVTVSTCTGTDARAIELARRFSAICESMEGAAIAHVAALYELPCLEVRGISNLVEDRDLEQWDLTGAAEAVARAVHVIVRTWT